MAICYRVAEMQLHCRVHFWLQFSKYVLYIFVTETIVKINGN